MKETNWTKWSSIAEIISSIAILVTLIYLAIQTQQTAKSMQSITSQDFQNQLTQSLQFVITDPQLEEIMHNGTISPQALSEQELRMYFGVWEIWLNTWQNIYIQDELGVLGFDPSGWYIRLAKASQDEGFKLYWEGNKYLYDPRFIDFMESEIQSITYSEPK